METSKNITNITRVSSNKVIATISAGKLGLLLDNYGWSAHGIKAVITLSESLKETERYQPAFSQQAQAMITDGTSITRIKGQSPLTAWAGFQHCEHGWTDDIAAPTLWIVTEQPSQSEIDTFQMTTPSWIIVINKKLNFKVHGMCIDECLQDCQLYQWKGEWSRCSIKTKKCSQIWSVWASFNEDCAVLERNIQNIRGITENDGKISVRNLQHWSRELKHTEIGQLYGQLQHNKVIAATDGSKRGDNAGYGIVTMHQQSGLTGCHGAVSGEQTVFRGE